MNTHLSKKDTARQNKTASLGPNGRDMLPFFYESDSKKKYSERWLFSVEVDDITRKSELTKCQLPEGLVGKSIPLEVDTDGWTFGQADTQCTGDWDKSW